MKKIEKGMEKTCGGKKKQWEGKDPESASALKRKHKTQAFKIWMTCDE